MNILEYFEQHPEVKAFEFKQRVFQPVPFDSEFIQMLNDTGLIRGVTETDTDLSYSRFISRRWYDRIPEQKIIFEDQIEHAGIFDIWIIEELTKCNLN